MTFLSVVVLFFFAPVLVRRSRAENLTVGVNDTRLVWGSSPNRSLYNPDCGGVNSLMRDETVSLNFTGGSPVCQCSLHSSKTPAYLRRRHRYHNQLRHERYCNARTDFNGRCLCCHGGYIRVSSSSLPFTPMALTHPLSNTTHRHGYWWGSYLSVQCVPSICVHPEFHVRNPSRKFYHGLSSSDLSATPPTTQVRKLPPSLEALSGESLASCS
jgi:hypothetical protein